MPYLTFIQDMTWERVYMTSCVSAPAYNAYRHTTNIPMMTMSESGTRPHS